MYMEKFKNEFFEENAPAKININIVEECIRYYHDEGELNSRSTMESHLESVKSFTVMYIMHFKQQGVYKYGNIFKSRK